MSDDDTPTNGESSGEHTPTHDTMTDEHASTDEESNDEHAPTNDEPNDGFTARDDDPAVKNDIVDGPPAPATGESDDDAIVEMDRRDYVRSVGALAAMGALGGAASSTAAAETADTSKTVDERIQEHRTGDLEVVVENPDGTSVSGAQVSIQQQSHDFRWGTAVHADTLINQSTAGDNYRTYIPELFNTAVMENQHKWALWENNQQLADDATNWILDQGLDMRGHVCVYGVDYAVPDDVQTAIDSGDTQTIRERSMQHIDEIMNHYGDQIHEWEVVNEVQHSTTIIDPFTSNPETAQIVADWYQQAQDVRPGGVTLAVNDYNALAGNYGSDQSGYQTHINHLLDNGIDLETIGIQCHFGQNETLSTSTIIETLNEYGQLTDTLKITEYDQSGSGWAESDKADWFERFLRVTFSHPGVESFLVWGFWDGRHWQDDAPFFTQDWSQKQTYDVYTNLVYGDWWTSDSGTTDSSGTYTTAAFLGDHEITVSTDSDETTTTTSVTNASGTTTVTVTVDGSGGGDTRAPSTPTNLSVSSTTDSTVTVTWDASSDNGSSGMDHYTVYVDGSQDHTVAAGMTTATVEGLSADTSYQIGVSAVDGAGNESSTTTVSATTQSGGGGGDALVVHEFETGNYPGSNDLGNWADGGSFQNSAGTVSSGALRLEYDNSGWFGSNVSQSITDRPTLNLRIRGDSGGEESHFTVQVGGASDVLANVTSDSIGTSYSTVSVDLEALGADLQNPESVRLDFWQGQSGAVEIDRIALGGSGGGGGSDATAPTTPSNLSVSSTTSSSVDVSWDASSDSGGSGIDHYNVSVDGSQDHTVAAGTTSTTVSGLAADTSYEVGVSAVDGAGNESSTTTVSATTQSGGGGGDDLLAELNPSTTSASVGERITFRVNDTSGSGQYIDSLDWTFGDGTTATGWWNAHSYDSAGTYTVALTATDNEGDTTTDEVTITVS